MIHLYKRVQPLIYDIPSGFTDFHYSICHKWLILWLSNYRCCCCLGLMHFQSHNIGQLLHNIVHSVCILPSVTDNCPTSISGRETINSLKVWDNLCKQFDTQMVFLTDLFRKINIKINLTYYKNSINITKHAELNGISTFLQKK